MDRPKWRGGHLVEIKQLQTESYEIAAEHGFHEGVPDIWKMLGNLHSEVSEGWHEAREPDFDPKRTYYRKDGKPEGLPTELADIIIRVCDTAQTFGIDLEAAIKEKAAYNKKRPYRHGNKRV